MEFKPLGDRIIARPVQLEKKTASGLILTATTDETSNRDTIFAKVVAVGEGKYAADGTLIPTKCKVGDIIVYNERMPLKFQAAEENYDVLNEANVLMIVSGEDVVESTDNMFLETARMLGKDARQL